MEMVVTSCAWSDFGVKWSSQVQVALGKWLTLENEKKTAFSQEWQHKKEKRYYQSFSLMVRYKNM